MVLGLTFGCGDDTPVGAMPGDTETGTETATGTGGTDSGLDASTDGGSLSGTGTSTTAGTTDPSAGDTFESTSADTGTDETSGVDSSTGGGAVCGDGLVDRDEACDDGNTDPDDGCNATCGLEPGWMCGGEPSSCEPTCGDGLVSGMEQCDDDNTDADDGCSANCGIEAGWMCVGEPSSCETICGDGIVTGPEECDDSGTDPDDGCSPSCTVENGWECTDEPSTCAPICGDDMAIGGEACDGSDLGGQTCFDFGGSLNGTLACDASCDFDLTGCYTLPGDVCLDPFVVDAVPYAGANDTSLFEHDYGYSAGACQPEANGYGNAARDVVYSFTAANDLDYVVQLDAGYDANLYVATDCTNIDNSCVVGDEDPLVGTESVQVTASAGTEYFVFVDGFSNANPDNAGAYDIDIWRVGDVCDAPIVIDPMALPFTYDDDSSVETGNDYGYGDAGCPGETFGHGAGSVDMAFSFTPTQSGTYEFTLTPNGWDSNLYVVTSCSAIDVTCLAANEEAGDGTVENVAVPMVADTTYYIIVDGWSNDSSQSGPFTLEAVQL